MALTMVLSILSCHFKSTASASIHSRNFPVCLPGLFLLARFIFSDLHFGGKLSGVLIQRDELCKSCVSHLILFRVLKTAFMLSSQSFSAGFSSQLLLFYDDLIILSFFTAHTSWIYCLRFSINMQTIPFTRRKLFRWQRTFIYWKLIETLVFLTNQKGLWIYNRQWMIPICC